MRLTIIGTLPNLGNESAIVLLTWRLFQRQFCQIDRDSKALSETPCVMNCVAGIKHVLGRLQKCLKLVLHLMKITLLIFTCEVKVLRIRDRSCTKAAIMDMDRSVHRRQGLFIEYFDGCEHLQKKKEKTLPRSPPHSRLNYLMI